MLIRETQGTYYVLPGSAPVLYLMEAAKPPTKWAQRAHAG